MSEFTKENFNVCDYPGLVDTWRQELERAGWQRTWNADGVAYRCPDQPESEGLCLSDAYARLNGDPTDWRLGIEDADGNEKEPPSPGYRRPA
jgi:hypothetical protein